MVSLKLIRVLHAQRWPHHGHGIKTHFFITILFIRLLSIHSIPWKRKKYSTQLNKSTWRLQSNSLQNIHNILLLTANFPFNEQLFQTITSGYFVPRQSRWIKTKIHIITLDDNWLKNVSWSNQVNKSFVPFDKGGNTNRHNGVKARTETYNIKNTYNRVNSQNANERPL